MVGAATGYEAVVAHPDHTVATRYGFEHGGRAVVRPDGYLAPWSEPSTPMSTDTSPS